MERRFRDHDATLKRRAGFREQKFRILIVCEGRKTEPLYFKWFQHHVRNRLVHVVIDDGAGVPLTLVQRAMALCASADDEARRQRDDNLRYDEAWCVFDVDEHPRMSEACAQAKAADIKLAISNPCFELWALLHFQEQSTSLDRHAARKVLKKHVPRYEKELPFERLIDGYPVAVQRASALDRRSSDTSVGRNPSTRAFRLTERIRAFGQP